MSVSQAQIVDLLYKQAFGVTKTDTATNKSPSNESIPSPLLLRGDTIWTQADQIPAVAAAVSGIVQAYTGSNAVEAVPDITTVPIGGIYPTWKTNLIYWVPSEFGATYTAQVWIDDPGASNPTSTGTQIFAAGAGGNGEYYYNYQSGVLNFIGESIPAALTSGKVLYIVGYRYIGLTGVTNLPSGTTIGNLTFNNSTIGSTANANIVISPNGSGIVKFTTDIEANANITANTLTVTGNANITGSITANSFTGNGAGLTGVVATAADKLSNGNTTVQTFLNGNVTFNIANTANVNVPIANILVVSTNGVDIIGNINATGNINGANINGNITGNISGNITIPGPNTGIVFNDNGTANSSNGFTFISGSNTANIANTLNVGNLLTVSGAINAFSTFNLTGNIALGSAYNNEIVNLSNTHLQIIGGNGNASGQVSLFTGSSTNSATLLLDAASNGILTQSDTLTVRNRANNATIVTFSNLTPDSSSTSTGAIVANGGVGVSGNVYVGGLINVSGNITTSALVSPSLTSNTANLVLSAASGNNSVVLTPTGTGTVDVSSKRITSLQTPSQSTDAATKQYVDDVAQGLHTHDSCNAATQTTLATISSGTVTYDNGTSGVGATLTTTGSYTTIDGVTLSNGMRILVKNEANTAHNGIYDRTSSTVLTRSTDFDTPAEMAGGDFTFVTAGTEYDNTGWVMPDPVTTVGTSPVVWVQFSGAGTYTAGAGLTLTGNQFSVNVDNNTTAIVSGNVVIKDGANLTTPNIGAATGTSLTLTNGVTANTLTANLTLNVTGNANVGNLGSSGVIIATGNITGGNISTSGEISATGNVSGGNLTTSGVVSATGNVSGGNLTTGGVVSATGNITGGNISTGGTLSVTGNANVGNIGAGTGVFTANISVANIANVGNLIATGTANVTGNATVGNLTTVGTVDAATVSTTTLDIGNTAVTANTVTSSTATLQTIASYALTGTGVTGIEFLVKGHDTTSNTKYSVATVLAVTNGTTVDYTVYGTVRIGTSTGTLSVDIVSGNIVLQATPSSSNTTVWTTQVRTI
jgi:hypothetical protein